jgi:hypothetical protein
MPSKVHKREDHTGKLDLSWGKVLDQIYMSNQNKSGIHKIGAVIQFFVCLFLCNRNQEASSMVAP